MSFGVDRSTSAFGEDQAIAVQRRCADIVARIGSGDQALPQSLRRTEAAGCQDHATSRLDDCLYIPLPPQHRAADPTGLIGTKTGHRGRDVHADPAPPQLEQQARHQRAAHQQPRASAMRGERQKMGAQQAQDVPQVPQRRERGQQRLDVSPVHHHAAEDRETRSWLPDQLQALSETAAVELSNDEGAAPIHRAGMCGIVGRMRGREKADIRIGLDEADGFRPRLQKRHLPFRVCPGTGKRLHVAKRRFGRVGGEACGMIGRRDPCGAGRIGGRSAEQVRRLGQQHLEPAGRSHQRRHHPTGS